jgi:hemoglobin
MEGNFEPEICGTSREMKKLVARYSVARELQDVSVRVLQQVPHETRSGESISMSTPELKQTLYEQLGGKPAVEAAVDLFYKKVLADERINHFFASIDMTRQIGKQKAFLTMAFGGPVNYTGLDMRKAHAHLIDRGLNDQHFNAVVEHLGQTLTELGVRG